MSSKFQYRTKVIIPTQNLISKNKVNNVKSNTAFLSTFIEWVSNRNHFCVLKFLLAIYYNLWMHFPLLHIQTSNRNSWSWIDILLSWSNLIEVKICLLFLYSVYLFCFFLIYFLNIATAFQLSKLHSCQISLRTLGAIVSAINFEQIKRNIVYLPYRTSCLIILTAYTML